MVYHKAQLGISEPQAQLLSAGDEVKLSHAHLQGSCEFLLTTAQMKRIAKARASGKGCLLKLSASQLKHMGQHGSGRFSDMLKAGYSYFKPGLRNAAKDGIRYGTDWAGEKLLDKVGLGKQEGEGFLDFLGLGVQPHHAQLQQMQQRKGQAGSGFLGDIIKGGSGWLVNKGVGALGLGVKPRKLTASRAKKQIGGGFLGDAIKGGSGWLINKGVGALGLGLPTAQNDQMLMSALGKKKDQPRGERVFIFRSKAQQERARWASGRHE